MLRIKSDGTVHYVNPAHSGYTLCTMTKGMDLLGNYLPLGDKTSDPVNCLGCAKAVCAIRNEPYNTIHESIDEKALLEGIYRAVDPPTVKTVASDPS